MLKRRRHHLQHSPAWRERYALGFLLLFVSLWGGMLVHSYTHRELAPAFHQHVEGEEPHDEENCSVCHIALPTLYSGVVCYTLPRQTIYRPIYHVEGAEAPILRSPTLRHGRGPPQA